MSTYSNSVSGAPVICYVDAEFGMPNPLELRTKLFALSKRFGLNIYLIINFTSELDGFIFPSLSEKCGITNIHITGNPTYTFSDAVAVAMRTKSDVVFLSSLHFLNENFNDIVRFIFESETVDRSSNVNSPISVGDFYFLSVVELRNLNFNYLGMSATKFWRHFGANAEKVRLNNVEPVEKYSSSNARQLFISGSAIHRMFGLDNLLKSDLLFDGLRPNDFKEICIVEINSISIYQTLSKKMIMVMKDFECDLDIYPAASLLVESEHDDINIRINIPRSIVHINMRDGVASSINTEEARVGYLMSNYNKSKYIVASVFSVLSQFHKNITLFFWDDASSDDSKAILIRLLNYIDLSKINITWNFGEVNRGTYWIRNDIVFQTKKYIDFYFVNDSDDYSSACRTKNQMKMIIEKPDVEVAMVDIVRTDSNYKLLSMNNEIERYGTATTAFRSSLIDKVGYFQVFRKNADTEFIERIKTFLGDKSVVRQHYPGLYQTFDGTNLTSDIYTISDGNSSIDVSTGLRGIHDLLWRKHHSRLTLANLASHYSFPESTIPGEFKRLDNSFFVAGYRSFDSVCVFINNKFSIDLDLYEQMKRSGYLLISTTTQGDLIFDKSGQDKFTTDLDFLDAVKAYLSFASFHGYILSASFLSKVSDFKKSPSSLLKNNIRELVHKSKSTGDQYIFDPHGSILPKSILSSSISSEVKFFASLAAI